MPKINPKNTLGLIILLLIFFLSALAIYFQKTPKSTLLVESKENKINLSFEISPMDKALTSEILETLSIPNNIYGGVAVDLDSTTSAKLAFFTPISVDLKIGSKKIDYFGRLSYLWDANIEQGLRVKVPQETNFIFFSKDITNFIVSRFNFSPGLEKTFKDNVSSNQGQYVAIYGERPEVIFIYRNSQDTNSFRAKEGESDFTSLEGQEQDIKTLIITYSDQKTKDDQALIVFKIDDINFITNSQDSAKKIIEIYMNDTSHKLFPSDQNENSIQAIIDFQNTKNGVSKKQLEFVLEKETPDAVAKEKIIDSLQKMESFRLTLEKGSFSGLMVLK